MDDRYAIATGKSYSYILQFAISLGQLYGTAVYYITAILEGDNFSTNSFYYYAYYIGANASWIVIPLIIAIRCWRKICAAFRVQGGQTKKPKVRWRKHFQVIGLRDPELIMMFWGSWDRRDCCKNCDIDSLKLHISGRKKNPSVIWEGDVFNFKFWISIFLSLIWNWILNVSWQMLEYRHQRFCSL